MGKLANSIARDIASPAVKLGTRSLFSVAPCRLLSLVLSFAPKESTIPRRGGSPIVRAAVGASDPIKGKFLTAKLLPNATSRGLSARPQSPSDRLRSNRASHRAVSPAPAPEAARQSPPGARVCAYGRVKGLSSGQTIGAARTAVRSACCLPERPVANRLRRLYPLDDGELFKFNLKSSVCQRQTGLPKGNPPCVFPSFPFGNPRAPKLAKNP